MVPSHQGMGNKLSRERMFPSDRSLSYLESNRTYGSYRNPDLKHPETNIWNHIKRLVRLSLKKSKATRAPVLLLQKFVQLCPTSK